MCLRHITHVHQARVRSQSHRCAAHILAPAPRFSGSCSSSADQLAPIKEQHIVFTSFELAQDGAARPQPIPREVPVTLSQNTESRSQPSPTRQPLQQVNQQLPMPPKPKLLADGYFPAKLEDVNVSTPLAPSLAAARQPSVASDLRHVKPQEPDREEDYKPRLQQNPFPAMEEEADEPPKRGLQIKAVLEETSTERLEAAVSAGVRVLSELEVPLKKLSGSTDASAWLEQIAKVRDLAARTRTIVGVVGNTGAGKSSVINAMLDEERLVPTNCMRACTAVVTELSYNHLAGSKQYRAEIEFIREADWRRELEILYKELIDENGSISREANNPDSTYSIDMAI